MLQTRRLGGDIEEFATWKPTQKIEHHIIFNTRAARHDRGATHMRRASLLSGGSQGTSPITPLVMRHGEVLHFLIAASADQPESRSTPLLFTFVKSAWRRRHEPYVSTVELMDRAAFMRAKYFNGKPEVVWRRRRARGTRKRPPPSESNRDQASGLFSFEKTIYTT